MRTADWSGQRSSNESLSGKSPAFIGVCCSVKRQEGEGGRGWGGEKDWKGGKKAEGEAQNGQSICGRQGAGKVKGHTGYV